ncbi:hypothetical protein ACQR1W_30970 [Bradyrhizobium sp. HKCCYLS1011]|uniref:hypothetical protein n=1 Tax=Bradyrhizobium sp. HKCCYLS1011 TaxID=3420733 RepID=UPI003EBD9075
MLERNQTAIAIAAAIFLTPPKGPHGSAMKTLTALAVALIAWIWLSHPVVAQQNDDVIVHHFDWIVQHDKQSFVEKTVKEANTPEGKAIIGAVATYIGVNPKVTSIGLAALAATAPRAGVQDTNGLIQSPVGYTICYARPSNPNMGAGDKGIETHGDSTFNSTINRVIPGNNFDGLGWSMTVPFSRGGDHRVAASFDVVMVKAVPGWQNVYKNCELTGEHPWLARNNSTQLNVPCNPAAEGAYCPK